MPIKKEYSQNNDECKVTFILSNDIAKNFHTISVLGDFNLWDQHINQFCKNEADGTCTATVIIEPQKNINLDIWQMEFIGLMKLMLMKKLIATIKGSEILL